MLTSLPSPSPFGAHRLSGRDEQQLRWYWQASERELGGRSNFEAVVQAAIPGRNWGSKPVAAARAVAGVSVYLGGVSDTREIEDRLGQVGRTHRRTLAAVYGPGLPPQAEATWGWLAFDLYLTAPLLLVTAERCEIGRSTLKAWRADNLTKKGLCKPRHGSLLLTLRQEADIALAVAAQAYSEARPAGRRPRPPR